MDERLTQVGIVMVLSLLVVGVLAPAAAGASQCQPIEDRQLCIADLSVSADQVVIGEQAAFEATIENAGNESATGAVMLHTASPENETAVYRLERVTLAPGATTTVSRAINASTPGTHGLRISLTDPETGQVYDVSAIETVDILASHPAGLGGPIDRAEIALGALLLSLLGLLGLGYRQYRS